MQNLQQAIDAINVDLVKEWLRLGADANLVPLRGESPLVVAVKKLFALDDSAQYPAMVIIIKFLLAAGANPNVMIPKQDYDNSIESLLHFLISEYKRILMKQRLT